MADFPLTIGIVVRKDLAGKIRIPATNYEGQSISNETFSITLVFLELCN